MKIFNFFKKDKSSKLERTEKPSFEHMSFSEKAIEILIPTFEKFGFKKHKIIIKKYSSVLIYRKNEQYLKVSGTTYPTDYPYSYNIILGEGNSDDFFEYDWNSVAIWWFKKKINPKLKTSEYEFPFEKEIEPSLKNANTELLKYGITFLKGDLNLFYEIRKQQNLNREPYKIHSQNGNGKLKTSFEEKSLQKKKKYS